MANEELSRDQADDLFKRYSGKRFAGYEGRLRALSEKAVKLLKDYVSESPSPTEAIRRLDQIGSGTEFLERDFESLMKFFASRPVATAFYNVNYNSYSSFQEAIEDFRRQADISVIKLAKLANVSPRTITGLGKLRTRKPRKDFLERLSGVFKINPLEAQAKFEDLARQYMTPKRSGK